MELLGGALSGQGCAAGDREMNSNDVLINAYHIEHFTDMETFYGEVEGLMRHVKSSRLAPGQPEFRTAEPRATEGSEVDDRTWETVCEIGAEFGVDLAEVGEG